MGVEIWNGSSRQREDQMGRARSDRFPATPTTSALSFCFQISQVAQVSKDFPGVFCLVWGLRCLECIQVDDPDWGWRDGSADVAEYCLLL